MDYQCPICASRNSEQVFCSAECNIQKCSSCDMVFLAGGEHVYDIASYDYYNEKSAMSYNTLYSSINEKRYQSLLTRLESYRKNNNILDVGCGIGHFVKAANTSGWDAIGIEVAPHAVGICRKHGIKVLEKDLLSMDEQDRYDIITLFDVIEHLVNPTAYVKKAGNILRGGGCVVITTPNFDSITRYAARERWRVVNKEHLCYFTPKTLCELFKKNGFKIKVCEVRNLEPQELLKLFRPDQAENRSKDQELRSAIEHNRILSSLKIILNIFLNSTRLGETIFLIAEKI